MAKEQNAYDNIKNKKNGKINPHSNRRVKKVAL